jgi:hypothetical protein
MVRLQCRLHSKAPGKAKNEDEIKRRTTENLKSFTRFVAAQTGVIVPLYKYPLKDYIPRIWAPLLNSLGPF